MAMRRKAATTVAGREPPELRVNQIILSKCNQAVVRDALDRVRKIRPLPREPAGTLQDEVLVLSTWMAKYGNRAEMGPCEPGCGGYVDFTLIDSGKLARCCCYCGGPVEDEAGNIEGAPQQGAEVIDMNVKRKAAGAAAPVTEVQEVDERELEEPEREEEEEDEAEDASQDRGITDRPSVPPPTAAAPAPRTTRRRRVAAPRETPAAVVPSAPPPAAIVETTGHVLIPYATSEKAVAVGEELAKAATVIDELILDIANNHLRIGETLATIKKGHLWKQEVDDRKKPVFSSFAEYTRKRWNMDEETAYRYIRVCEKFTLEDIQEHGVHKLAVAYRLPNEIGKRLLKEGASRREIEEQVKKQRALEKGEDAKPEVLKAPIPLKRNKVKLFARPTMRGDEPKPAKRLADEPYGTLELEHGVSIHFTLSVANGQLVLTVEPRRVE